MKLDKKAINYIEDKIGDLIDWRGAIETALIELKMKGRKTSNVK